jgi:hypothetical protein
MDHFSIPDRLEPVAPTESARRQSLTSDQQRQRKQEPSSRQPHQDNAPDPSQEDDDSHNVDELA